jgi:hypothetical protein
MAYTARPRTASQLTVEARAAAAVSSTGYALSAYLPDTDNYSLNFNFDVNQIAINDPASFRSYNTGSDVGRTGGTQSRSGRLPAMSRRYDVVELDQLLLFGQSDAIAAEYDKYARLLGASMAARVELARGQAIETGAVVIAERDLSFTIDYGRHADHSITAPIVWTDTTADVLGDLDTASAVYLATNGAPAGEILISTARFVSLQKNVGIIKAAVQRGSDLPTRISQADVRSVLSDYGFPFVRVFDEVIGTQRVIGADKVVFVPSNGSISFDGGSLGTTDWGIPAEAINGNYGISASDRPGIFAGAFTSEDPEGSYVLASAICIPVLTNANATLTITV